MSIFWEHSTDLDTLTSCNFLLASFCVLRGTSILVWFCVIQCCAELLLISINNEYFYLAAANTK